MTDQKTQRAECVSNLPAGLSGFSKGDMDMGLTEQRDKGIEFCDENLIQCCVELLAWKRTGLLQDGKVRELSKMLDFAGYSAMALAEEFIKTAAMERLVLSQGEVK